MSSIHPTVTTTTHAQSASNPFSQNQIVVCKKIINDASLQAQQAFNDLKAAKEACVTQLNSSNEPHSKLWSEVVELRYQKSAFQLDEGEWKKKKAEYLIEDAPTLKAISHLSTNARKANGEHFQWNLDVLNDAVSQINRMRSVCSETAEYEKKWSNYNPAHLVSKEKALKDLEGEITTLKAKIAHTDENLKAAERTLRNISNIFQAFHEMLSKTNVYLDEEGVKRGTSILEGRISHMDQELTKFTSQMVAWQNSPRNVEIKALIEKQAALKDLENQKNKLQAKHDASVMAITSHTRQIETNSQSIKDLRVEVEAQKEAMRNYCTRFKEDYEKAKKENGPYQKTLLALKETEDQDRTLQSELANIKNTYTQLRRSLDQNGRAWSTCLSEIEAAQKKGNISNAEMQAYHAQEKSNHETQKKFDFDMQAMAAGINALKCLKQSQKVTGSPTSIITQNTAFPGITHPQAVAKPSKSRIKVLSCSTASSSSSSSSSIAVEPITSSSSSSSSSTAEPIRPSSAIKRKHESHKKNSLETSAASSSSSAAVAPLKDSHKKRKIDTINVQTTTGQLPLSTSSSSSSSSSEGHHKEAASANRDLTQVTPSKPLSNMFPEGSLHALISGAKQPLTMAQIESHLAKHQQNINDSIHGWTPLLLLIRKGHVEVIEAFIKEMKPNLQVTTPDGWNALQLCCFIPRMNTSKVQGIIEELSKVLDVNEPANAPPLHIAASKNHGLIIDALNGDDVAPLNRNKMYIDPNLFDSNGYTAGHYASLFTDGAALTHIVNMKLFDPSIVAKGGAHKGKTVMTLAEQIVHNPQLASTLADVAKRKGHFSEPKLGDLLHVARSRSKSRARR